MKDYMFTIITVCYNAEKDIKKTIMSLLEQTYDNYEYIIKDGMSSDQTMEIVQSLVSEKENIQIISEPDAGIYDAMNQAVDIARGEYIFFLNAGDCFADKNVLENVRNFIYENNFADVVYGDIILVNNGMEKVRKYSKICSSKMYFLSGDCICHQAMFSKRTLFTEKKFDLSYSVCADKEWQLYLIECKKIFLPINLEIAKVLQEGFSTNHIEDFENESERCINLYCNNYRWIYNCIQRLKHNKYCVEILRMIGNVLFTEKQ